MKKVKDKQLLVGADFAGYPLKEAVCAHLRKKGWTITDVGVRADSDPDDTDLMFHRVGLRVGSGCPARHHRQRRKRFGHGCLLCCAANGMRYCRRLFKRKAWQRI